MRLTCEFTPFYEVVSDLAIVADDSMASEEMRNIIFRIVKDDSGVSKLILIGANNMITSKRYLSSDKYNIEIEDKELVDDIFTFQVKCKELMQFLSSYKSTRRTIVKEVSFRLNDRKAVICEVLELDKETEVPYLSNWVFNPNPVKEAISMYINLDMPEQTSSIDTASLLLPVRTLLPILSNVNTLYGQLVVGEDKVVAFNPTCTSLMNNTMKGNGVFENISIPYRGVAVIDKLLNGLDFVSIGKTSNYIYIGTDSSETFIRFLDKLADYKSYISAYKQDSGIMIDRLMLKDVLKRLSILSENIEFIVKPSEDLVTLKNSKFSMDISILQKKGMESFEGTGFKISPDVLNRVLVGSDDEFDVNTRIYYCPVTENKASIVFSDLTDMWFSMVSVPTFKNRSL